MKIEFDPEKDKANIAKHGVSLSMAADFDMEEAAFREDTDGRYGERRIQAIGPIGSRLYMMIFTVRDVVRVISLRAADPKERRWYRDNVS